MVYNHPRLLSSPLVLLPSRRLTILRAGANFSAISGTNQNALRWDRGGYQAMWKLVEEDAQEAKYIAKTPSTEYFDEMPDEGKISSMKEYLQDVSLNIHE
jgi:hypothetical protein